MTDPGDDLDLLLGAWASATRLPAAEAERIRQAIVPVAEALPAAWWTDFNTKLSGVVTRATMTPGPALAAFAA
jgi:hypothetical protein